MDVLKVGVPANLAFVEGSAGLRGEALFRHSDAIAHYRRAVAGARIPFIYLSEGVSNETFQFALELATEAGIMFSGVLCWRATWQDGVPFFAKDGAKALDDWLLSEGVQKIKNLNRCRGAAHSWFSISSQPASPTASRSTAKERH